MIIWHGKRHWVQNPKSGQHRGWNTDFEPCVVGKITPKRICILSPSLGVLYLNRAAFEKDGKVYHSKPCEYFYKCKPLVDPERPQQSVESVNLTQLEREALAFLDLVIPASQDDIIKAYKSKAKVMHPDGGGSHEDFLNLQSAYNTLKRVFK